MNDALDTPQRILLLGATSEIGLAVVRRLLPDRPVEVVLAGRPSARRDAATAALEGGHVSVRTVDFDALDDGGHDAVLDAAWAHGDVDVAVVAFGVLGDHATLLAEPDRALDLVRVNYLAAVGIGLGVSQRMQRQGHGRILALSSTAAERPRKSNFLYGSSKAGFDAFFSGLADHLHGTGVYVSVLRPGFVHSRMTAGMEPAPLATTPDAVADVARRALRRRRPVAWAPPLLRVLMLVLRVVPRVVWRRIER